MMRLSVLLLCAVFIAFSLPAPAWAQSSFQPSAPYYATFFYLWSENPNTDGIWSYWSDRAHTPPQNWFSNYLPDPQPGVFAPQTELYSSSNDQIIYWQLRKLAEAKQEVAIASWWGPNHKSDRAFNKIITDIMNRPDNPYPNLRWSMYYEKEGFGTIPLTELESDLNYIKSKYTTQPGYFKINGKPVIFVYNAAHSGYNAMDDLARWQTVRDRTGFYVVLKVDPLTSGAAPTAIDSWHEYAPANRTGTRGNFFYFVSPAFWLEGNAPRLVRDLTAFKTGVTAMVQSNTLWKLTETWNEWGEGSSVEPGDPVRQVQTGTATFDTTAPPFQNQYVDALNTLLPPLEQGTGAGGTTPTITATPTPVAADPVVIAVGDIACGADSAGAACKEWETSELARRQNPQGVLILGDNQYEQGQLSYYAGTDPYCQSNPPRCYNGTWGRLKSITYPAVGNHEYLTPNAAGHFDYFNGTGNATGRAGDRSKGYYSYNIGDWHLIALNSNCSRAGGCGAGSPQEQWLRQDLAANPKCTIAYMHHALYSSGHDGNNTTLLGQMRPLYQALYDAKADIVLAGHSHHYERFALQNAQGAADQANGFRQFVVGTGGRNFTGYWTTTMPNSEVKHNTSFGVLKLTLHNASYEWNFLPVQGSAFTDFGNAFCHRSAPTPTATITAPPSPTGSSCNKSSPSQFSCYGQWYAAYHAGGNPTDGDFNGDGRTSLTDFEFWRRLFIDANTPSPTP